jgi:hypothetical protein
MESWKKKWMLNIVSHDMASCDGCAEYWKWQTCKHVLAVKLRFCVGFAVPAKFSLARLSAEAGKRGRKRKAHPGSALQIED